MQRQTHTTQTLSNHAPPAGAYLRTFGRLQLHVSTENTASALGAKALAMLAYLVAAPNRSATRERIAELLWSQVNPECAMQSIRQAKSQLKQACGFEVVQQKDAALVLSSRVCSDYLQFRLHIGTGDYANAVGLLAGAFCEGFSARGADEFDAWLTVERATLAHIGADCIAAQAAAALGQLRCGYAVELAHQLARVDPSDERVWRIQLEAALLREDRCTLGLVADCTTWLRHETVEPSRTLVRLLDRARQAGTSTAGWNTERPQIQGDVVGREVHFARLVDAWNSAQQGKGSCLLVSATAGMGKTRLLDSAFTRFTGPGASVVRVAAHPADRHVPYGILARVVTALVELPGALALAGEHASVLLTLNAAIATAFPSAPAYSSSQPALLVNYRQAVKQLLGAISEERPVALLIDDLHWADDASAALLASLCQSVGEASQLLVFTTRPHTGLRICAEVIPLPPLSRTNLDELLASMGRTCQLDEEVRAELHRLSHGIPFSIIETLKLAIERDCIGIAEGAWCITNRERLLAMLVAGTAIDDRIGVLDRAARRLALALAVAGKPIPAVAPLEKLTDGDPGTALHSLEMHDIARCTTAGWSLSQESVAGRLLALSDLTETREVRIAVARMWHTIGGTENLRAAAREFALLQAWPECALAIREIAAITESRGMLALKGAS